MGAEHTNTLEIAGNLAKSLSDQGKHAEAEQMQPELRSGERNEGCGGGGGGGEVRGKLEVDDGVSGGRGGVGGEGGEDAGA